MKKLVIFLVEGETDKIALAKTISDNLKPVAKFHVIRTDITSDMATTVDNVESLIAKRIGYFFTENPQYNFEDVLSVIQITDTDGTYVEGSKVIYDNSNDKVRYNNDSISTMYVEEIKNRNKRKSSVLNYLSTLNTIKYTREIHFKYRIYFMSCNMEHVLHDLPNVATAEEKERLAKQFRREAGKNVNKLRDILFLPSIDCGESGYDDSWKAIKKGTTSLKRKSNFSHFFREYIDKN